MMYNKTIPVFVISISFFAVLDLFSSLNLISGNALMYLKLLSLIAFVYSSYKLITEKRIENKYLKYIFIVFILYEFILVFRGISFSFWYLIEIILSSINFWPLTIPLFVLFDKKISTLVLLMKYIYFISIFFLLINLIYPTLLTQRQTAETVIGIAISSGFLLLNSSYLNNYKVNISFLVIFISLLSVTYLARRSVIITLSGFIVASYILNFKIKTKPLLFRMLPIVIGLFVFILFSFSSFTQKITNKLNERLTEDTRTGVFELYFIEMQDYMYFGKGMNGKYYLPIEGGIQEDGSEFTEEEYRTVIENGYLQLMLTGGILHIILFLMLLLPAAIIGVFKSSNNFTRACGMFVFLRLIDMLIFGLPSFSLSYILVWICVGICYSSSFRLLSDEFIRSEFKKNILV